MKIQLKPGEPVKYKGARLVATESEPVFLTGERRALLRRRRGGTAVHACPSERAALS